MDLAAESLIAWQPHPATSPATTALAAHYCTVRTLAANVTPWYTEYALWGLWSITTIYSHTIY